MAKCVECGTDAAYGCQMCSSCSKKALRAVLRENPELKQAFMETIEEMRRPENIKKMAEQITPVIQAVAALKGAVDHEAD